MSDGAGADANDGHGEVPVRDDKQGGRFVIEQDGLVAELLYDEDPGRLILVHTEVPDALEHHGLGGRLVQAAVDRAAAEHVTVVPWCPFAGHWLREHPDVAATVEIDWTPPHPPR